MEFTAEFKDLQYSCYALVVGPFRVSITWVSDGFQIETPRGTLTSKSRDLEEAKQRAYRALRVQLQAGLDALKKMDFKLPEEK